MENTHRETSKCCGGKNSPMTKAKMTPARRMRPKMKGLQHPDHSAQIARLNRVMGQIAGVRRMIEDRRYCPEILVQTRAIASAFQAIETQIMERHLRHCIAGALTLKNPRDIDRKIDELVTVLDRF